MPEFFGGYPVLGKVPVAKRDEIREIATSVQADIRGPGGAAACFWPRHGVRAEALGKHVEFIICFECRETLVIVSDGLRGRVAIADGAATVLNRILKAGGVTPLEPPKEK